MLPEPLHPALVHLPLAWSVLLPLVMAVALLAIRRGADPRQRWRFPVVLAAAVTLSAWAAVQAGEADGERIEERVDAAALEEHEEAGERFLFLSVVVLVITAAGFLPASAGAVARPAGGVAAVLLLGAGLLAGHAGGELVYEHGAAAAHAEPTGLQDVDRDSDDEHTDEDTLASRGSVPSTGSRETPSR